MRLQSKKLNQPFPPAIAGVFLLSLIYWFYLSLTTRMEIMYDSIDYTNLGRMLENQGWVAYLTNGPNREPLYPLLVAISMHLEHVTAMAFDKIMAFFGVIILFISQVLTYKILRLLNIRNGICILVLTYLALSPALNNSAFSLYSEIATLPIILGIILISADAWEVIKQNESQKAFSYGALLGILLVAATFVKAVFECVTPVYLIIFFATVSLNEKNEKTKKLKTLLFCLAAAISFFYVPIIGYKWLNLHYNGNFVITNRGSAALYGSTARRMKPLTLKRFAEALAFVPGEGVCTGIFGTKECTFWSFNESDYLADAEIKKLALPHIPPDEINDILLNGSAQKALQNPFQYILLTFVEGLKMFFWESTQVGFVAYPHWLQKIYDVKIFNNGLRLLTSSMTLIAVLSLWFQTFVSPKSSPIGFLMGLLIFLYTLFFSFFFILTRYGLPIAPLYLIIIGIWINQNLPPKEIK